MSLPKLTAMIGDSIPLGDKAEFVSLVKNIKKVKKDEEPYIVFLVIDLLEEELYFKVDNRLTEDSKYDYYYFGNNSGSSMQYYLTRETKSLKYLLSSTFNDLFLQLKKHNMQGGKLAEILIKMQDKNLIILGDKKGEGRLAFDKFSLVKKGKVDNIELDDNKNIMVDGKKYNPEKFIRLFIEDENKKNKFVLVVPKVVLESGKEIVLSQHPEYLNLVKIENNLGSSNNKESSKKDIVCHICKQRKPDVSSSYSKKFSRIGINKIFTTTTKNAAPLFKENNYDISYSMCGDCYQKLLIGEKIILKQFRSKIAGEDAFIIPEGMLQKFDYKFLNQLKSDVDLAFKNNDARAWLKNIENEEVLSDVKNYAINFIIYRTDGKSVTVLETIEDVPVIRFERVMEALSDYTQRLKPHTDNISIGTIYRLIPVKVDKKRNQIDIGRVLSLYKAILSGEKINPNVLFDYVTEALEKGLRQLSKSKIDNYYNMGITRFKKGHEDFFIRRIVYGYIVLFKVCQELGVLEKEIFKESKEGKAILNDFKTGVTDVDKTITDIEEHLENQGFDNKARALFYLGVLINRVAMAQYQKEHKKKPILKKIQFQGMSKKDIYYLYADVVEKLIQYERMNLSNEAYIRRFHDYFESLNDDKSFRNEKANVFYIMAGYSYLVGRSSNKFDNKEKEPSSN